MKAVIDGEALKARGYGLEAIKRPRAGRSIVYGDEGIVIEEFPRSRGLARPRACVIGQAQELMSLVTPQHARHLAVGNILANAHRATIDVDRKLKRYALDPSSPRGRHKARVFQSALGYDSGNVQGLVDQILEGIARHAVIPGLIDEHGVRFRG